VDHSALFDLLDRKWGVREVHRNEWALTECPNCGGKNKRFINPVRWKTNCFVADCPGHVGNLSVWLADELGVSTDELIRRLELGVDDGVDGYEEAVARFDTPPPVQLQSAWQPGFYLVGSMPQHPTDQAARLYLEQRGFRDPLLWQQLGLCWSNVLRFANRLILPVYEDGQLVYFQARALQSGMQPKYLNPKKEDGLHTKGTVVWNLDVAQSFEWLYICEGIFNAMAIGLNAVACFGTVLSDTQISKIVGKSQARGIILVYDYGAEESRDRTLARLQGYGRHIGYVNMYDERDINDHLRVGGAAAVQGLIQCQTVWTDGWTV
jgi:hypothetical protein